MKYLNIIIKYGLYLILFLPLIFTPFTMFPWQFGKVVFFQIIVEIIFLIFLLKLAADRPNTYLKKLNWLDLSVLALLLVLVLTSITGENFLQSFFNNQARAQGVFLWLHLGVYYLILVNIFKNKKDWQRYLSVAVIAAVIVGLTAALQSFLPLSWRGDVGPRLSGIIGNPAFLAAYLVMPVFILFYLAIESGKLAMKFIWLGLAVFLLVILYLTGIRGAHLALVFGLVLSILLVWFKLKAKKLKLIIVGSLILILLAGGLSIFMARPNFFKSKVSQASSLASDYLKSPTGLTRLMAWQIAWRGFLDNPIIGVGPGNYEVIFNKDYNPEFLRYTYLETLWDKPHNLILEILATSGFLGAVAYLSIWLAAAWSILKKQKELNFRQFLPQIILITGLAVYFIQNLFLFETFNSLLIFFLVMAFISANYFKYEVKVLAKSKYFLAAPVLFLLIILFFISFYKFNYLALKSSYYMNLSNEAGIYKNNLTDWSRYTRLALATPSYLKIDNAILAAADLVKMNKQDLITNGNLVKESGLAIVETLEQYGQKYKSNYLYPVWAGQVDLVLGQQVDRKYYDEAIKNLNLAKGIAPNKQEVYFLLGRAYLLKNDLKNSLAVLKKAVDLSPTIGDTHWFYGLVLVADGQKQAGLAEMEKALALDNNVSDTSNILYLIDLLAQDKNYDKVIKYYNLLASYQPSSATWHTRLAATYVVMGDKAKALAEVNIAVELEPDLRLEAEKFIKDNNLK